jgi:uncharacterized protein
MAMMRVLFSIIFTLCCTYVMAGAPAIDAPLPLLSITERGELTMTNDDFAFVPWRSDANLGKPQVFQYFGATMSDSEIFKPFTDLLSNSFPAGTIHVTTVLNLDAAMWGTTGFVISELEKNKKVHPTATMVVDEAGSGVSEWDLGKDGRGLIITDDKGVVQYFTRQAMSAEEMAAALVLLGADGGS